MQRASKYVVAILALLIFGTAGAETNIVKPNLDIPTKIAPAYFGPNAFPVPDMLTGRTSSVWKLETPNAATCPKCGAVRLPHRICKACMTYGDKTLGEPAATAAAEPAAN